MSLGYPRRWVVVFEGFLPTCMMAGTEEREHVKTDLGLDGLLSRSTPGRCVVNRWRLKVVRAVPFPEKKKGKTFLNHLGSPCYCDHAGELSRLCSR
jgi:hypothetical protein